MDIDHINISAPIPVIDIEKEFFCRVFDLKVGERPKLSSSGYWLYSGNKALIHLVQSDAHVAPETNGYLDHIAFKMDNFEAFVAKLNDFNITFKTIEKPNYNMAQVFLRSPAGIGLEAKFSLK